SDAAFLAAAEEGLSRPERVPARLFQLRAAALLHGLDPIVARSQLSGYLIGAELASARAYWLGREVVLIGADRLAAAYRDALALAGLTARAADAAELTRAGLAAAHEQLEAERRRG